LYYIALMLGRGKVSACYNDVVMWHKPYKTETKFVSNTGRNSPNYTISSDLE